MSQILKAAVIGSAAILATGHPISQEMVNEIRSSNALWTPMEVSENPLAHYTHDELRGLLGTIIEHVHSDEVPLYEAGPVQAAASFDSRSKWPGCVH